MVWTEPARTDRRCSVWFRTTFVDTRVAAFVPIRLSFGNASNDDSPGSVHRESGWCPSLCHDFRSAPTAV